MSINVKGPCELTAAALAVDDQIEVVNRDLHIATLNEDADLIMHLTLEKGRGYVSAANNKNPNTPIGVIPTDSIFTPIRKVNYTVENTRRWSGDRLRSPDPRGLDRRQHPAG